MSKKSLDFEKLAHSQNRVGDVQIYDSKRLFFTQNFFSKALRKFSVRRMTMFNISGRLSKIISLRSKRNQSHTTHQTDYMSGNVAKV